MLTKIGHIYQEEGKDGVVRRLQSRYRLGSTIMSKYGVLLTCNYGDRTFKRYVNGTYGTYLWDHISQISDPFVFLDIGANQGLYTLCAAQNPQSVMCHAFEPNAQTYDLLTKNVTINAQRPKCALHNVAISDTAGSAELTMAANHSGSATMQVGRTEAQAFDVTMRIDTISHPQLDDMLDDSDAPLIVKIDVEGFERTVLDALMASRHAGRIQEIFYEVDEQWVDAPELIRLLEDNGFSTFKQIGDGSHYDVHAMR